MKKLLVLGAGTAGTMVVNRLRQKLDPDEWQMTIVDKDECHLYQPGFLFIPFGIYSPRDVQRPRRDFLPPGVEMVLSDIDVIEPERNRVKLADGRLLDYDYLIVATKADKLSGNGREKAKRMLAKQLDGAPLTEPILYSAKTGLGTKPVWRYLDQALAPKKDRT